MPASRWWRAVPDSTVRSLAGIAGASSSRVLNLLAIGQAQAGNSQAEAAPFFESPILNNAILLKHRLRSGESDVFAERRVLATKIIIPFERNDLKVGGRSMFVGQRNFETMLREIGNYRDLAALKRDLDVLRLVDGLPSLDPFLLREHLRAHGFAPDACYFEISAADQRRMLDYAGTEVSRLTDMASGRRGGMRDAYNGRLVAALLSSEVSEKLEPLRATLALAEDEFREGVFSWRGFLYYKWSLVEFWPDLVRALTEIKAAHPAGPATREQRAFVAAAKQAILAGVRDSNSAVRKVIGIYDEAYATLIDRHDPLLFRRFLLGAPGMFVALGEKMGAMSHLTSFWNYRFPPGSPIAADAEELSAIFHDFARALGQEAQSASLLPALAARAL